MKSFVNFNRTELERPIYRFMSFARLIELFRTCNLSLVRTSKWDDPFENLIVSARYNHGDGGWDSVLRHVLHGSCWTRKSVSDALWRIYSPDKLSVRIASTPAVLGSALEYTLKSRQNSNWFIGRVKYLPQSIIIENATKLAKQIVSDKSDKSAAQSVLFKRRSFSHEDEVRVLVIDRHNQSKGGILRLKVDPHEIIKSIMIDSRAPVDIADMYKNYLKQQLGFKGRISKSTLYDLPEKLIVELEK